MVLHDKKPWNSETFLGHNFKAIWESDPIFMTHKFENFWTKLNLIKAEVCDSED